MRSWFERGELLAVRFQLVAGFVVIEGACLRVSPLVAFEGLLVGEAREGGRPSLRRGPGLFPSEVSEVRSQELNLPR